MTHRNTIPDALGSIYLIGFSGSGKSTVGPRLARKLRREFVDLDDEIASEAGMSISEIFAEFSEREFRRRETEALRRIAGTTGRRLVVALGGGAFQRAENRQVVNSNGITVYLSCAISQLYRRLKDKTDRPMLHRPGTGSRELLNRMTRLLKKRKPTYALAEVIVSTTSRTAAETVELIVDRIMRRYGGC